jgi:hypothetical protein
VARCHRSGMTGAESRPHSVLNRVAVTKPLASLIGGRCGRRGDLLSRRHAAQEFCRTG